MTLSKRALGQLPEERIAPLKVLGGDPDKLLVHEIYASVQGESTWAGVPCTFVRTTGCHLRCTYCDTEHAFEQGTVRSVAEVVSEVGRLKIPIIEVTGGEPLLQRGTFTLLTALADAGMTVLLETSGGVAVDRVDPRVRIILDIKTPSSGEVERNIEKNFGLLVAGKDEVKLVISDEADYRFATAVVGASRIPAGVTTLFSPAAPRMDPAMLAEWIIRDRLPVRFQVQLHKVLWGSRIGV